jgi:hypothetical protein
MVYQDLSASKPVPGGPVRTGALETRPIRKTLKMFGVTSSPFLTEHPGRTEMFIFEY